MMTEIPVLIGFRDVVKQLRQLQFFSLTCEDSHPAIHSIVEHFSLVSSLAYLQITLVTPDLDLTLLTPHFDASLASIVVANAAMKSITLRFQYVSESVPYIQRDLSQGSLFGGEIFGDVGTGTGILEEFLPLTSKKVCTRLLRARGNYYANPGPEKWETMD